LLSVANKPCMLSVIMISAVMQNVVPPVEGPIKDSAKHGLYDLAVERVSIVFHSIYFIKSIVI
jgi:hypothetical protein